jgi:hypothetical protein
MSIVDNKERVAAYTSSEIVKILTFGTRPMTDAEIEQHLKENPKSKKKNIECWPGDAAVTYILEKQMEQRLGRTLDTDVDARPTQWGKFLEPPVFEMLPEYLHLKGETFTHEKYPFWRGSADGLALDTTGDTKCPFTLSSFCQLVDPLYAGLEGMDAMNAIRNGWVDKNGLQHKPHKDGEKFYQQIVSGSCIHTTKYGELIVYMPRKADLARLKLLADGNPDAYWIWAADDNKLPYLPDNCSYNSLNRIKFEIPVADKEFLEEYVVKAGKYLQ